MSSRCGYSLILTHLHLGTQGKSDSLESQRREALRASRGACASPWEQQRLCKMVEGSQRRAGPLLIFGKDLCQQTHRSLSSELPGLLRESTVFSLPSAPSPARSSPLPGWLALHRDPAYTRSTSCSMPEPLPVAFTQHRTLRFSSWLRKSQGPVSAAPAL